MHNPPHPGTVLKRQVVDALGLSATQVAEHLGMTRVPFSRVLNGRAAISPALSVSLEKAGFGTARSWTMMQANYDLWQAKKAHTKVVRRYVPVVPEKKVITVVRRRRRAA